MRKSIVFLFLCLFFYSIFPFALHAQSSSSSTSSTQFDMTGFPLWAKDLRRGEIVALGSFPFAYFFSNFGFDTYRFFSHNYDTRYAPWPFNSAATIEQTQNEKFLTIGIAAGAAIVVAIVDFAIMRYNRNREQAELRNLPEGTPIITTRPLWGEEADQPDGGD